MIIDKLENISKYKPIISDKVIEFLKNILSDTPTGHYEIENGVYANIDEYSPKQFENCKFEAHKKYIDIQMILSGEENLEYTNADGLEVAEEYDENRDVMFFKNTKNDTDIVNLTPYKFAFIYPHEAHKPQIKTTSDYVKKVVVKIPNVSL